MTGHIRRSRKWKDADKKQIFDAATTPSGVMVRHLAERAAQGASTNGAGMRISPLRSCTAAALVLPARDGCNLDGSAHLCVALVAADGQLVRRQQLHQRPLLAAPQLRDLAQRAAPLCKLIGEPIRQSAELTGDTIKGRVKTGNSQSSGVQPMTLAGRSGGRQN